MQGKLKTLSFWLLLFFMGLAMLGRAAGKPFWFDEILTLRIAECRLGPEMWRAITTGFEFNPPGIYVATRLSEMAFGRGLITSRLPSILGGLIVLYCAFRVNSRKGGAAAGFGSLFLFFFSGAFGYFVEDRGYALVMAGTMIAWVSWQDRVDGSPRNASRRPLQLLGIFLGLTLALFSHMWALVVPVCFVVSALARWLRNKVFDAGALCAMCAPCLMAVIYVPIVAASHSVRFGGDVYNTAPDDAYGQVIGHIQFLLLMCGIVFVAVSVFLSRAFGVQEQSAEMKSGLLLEDWVLALCLTCAPLSIFVATKAMHSAFMARYALVAVLGLTFLLAPLFSLFAQKSRVACYGWLFILGLGLSASAVRSVATKRHPEDSLNPELKVISGIAGNSEPIVYDSGVIFLPAEYYAKPEIARRLVYVADRDLSRQIIDTDGVDSALLLARSYLKLRGQLISYTELGSRYQNFWLVDDSKASLNWLSEKLRSDGAEIRALNIPNTRIFHVALRPAQTK